MAHKTADKLVFCHEAMHVQLRMQDAGWSPDVERHQSDVDSDDSAIEQENDEDESSAALSAVDGVNVPTWLPTCPAAC